MLGCNFCKISLYQETLANAIKCKMDRLTIVNLKDTHYDQVKKGFTWSQYLSWLYNLNEVYKENLVNRGRK